MEQKTLISKVLILRKCRVCAPLLYYILVQSTILDNNNATPDNSQSFCCKRWKKVSKLITPNRIVICIMSSLDTRTHYQCGTRQTSTSNILTPSIPLCKQQRQNYAKPYQQQCTTSARERIKI